MSKSTSIPRSAAVGKSSTRANGCRSRLPRNAKTLADLVEAYEKCQQISEKGWNPLRSLLEGNKGLGDLEAAIKSAALAEDLVGKSYQKEWNGKIKRHGHQRRIKQTVLKEGLKTLISKVGELKSCKSFDAIFDCVWNNCRKIPGLGPLYIYDTALRIGAFLNKLPKRVHLQAGALAGARVLGLDVKNAPLPVSEFPKPMQRLAPHEIEDFLCIYKGELKKIKI
jgi:hypothetical protein